MRTQNAAKFRKGWIEHRIPDGEWRDRRSRPRTVLVFVRVANPGVEAQARLIFQTRLAEDDKLVVRWRELVDERAEEDGVKRDWTMAVGVEVLQLVGDPIAVERRARNQIRDVWSAGTRRALLRRPAENVRPD